MTRVAILTTLLTPFTLLLCTSMLYAQEDVVAGSQNRFVPPIIQADVAAKSINVTSAGPNVDQLNRTYQQPGSEIPQARPGERVTNPAHGILNLDTTLGGVPVKGANSGDFGYIGPGDMRTHLWNSHAKELIENGITEFKLMAMTVPEVQQWHNHFHGMEGSPEHPHHDDDHGQLDSIDQKPTMSTPTYVDDPIHGTIVYENPIYSASGYHQSVHGQPEIIYEQSAIIQEFNNGSGTQIQPTRPSSGVTQTMPSGRRSSRRGRFVR